MSMRIGITKNTDGTLSAGPCKAKPGNEGTGRCHHFMHAGSRKEAERFISSAAMHPGLVDAVDVSRDLTSMPDALQDYLVRRGVSPEDLPDGDVSIKSRWFHNDSSKAGKYLQEAQDEGVLPKIKAVESVRKSVTELVSAGVRVTASADRVLLKTPEEEARETDVWMVANGIDAGRPLEGEPPVTLMVAEGKQEMAAAAGMRSAYVQDSPLVMSEERAADLANADYASLAGHGAGA